MKSIGVKMTKGLNIGSRVQCIDNSGAKELQIIGVKGKKGVRRRVLSAGIGDLVLTKIVKGSEKLKGEVFLAVIVRQKKEFERKNGLKVRFEDNAAILLDDNKLPKGSKIKGPIAKEVIQRFSSVGKVAKMVV